MKSRSLAATALCALTALPARAQPTPTICPTAPNTVAIDMGAYHGSAWVADADGKPAFPNARYECPASRVAHAWEGCSFSVCGLPDGDYAFRFTRAPPPADIAFTLQGGMVRMGATPLAVQVGNYGIDATSSTVKVVFELGGYTGAWAVEGFPAGTFHGLETGGRGQAADGAVTLNLYPATPYAVRFGEQTGAIVTAGYDGTLQLAAPTQPAASPASPAKAPHGAGQVLALRRAHLVLRGANILVAPLTPNTSWRLQGGQPAQGAQTLRLPAASSVMLADTTHGASETITLDSNCHPTLSGGAAHLFSASPAVGSMGCTP